MAKLSDLPSKVADVLYDNLDTSSLLALRFVNRALKQKTESNFFSLFLSIKLSFCQASLDDLDEISQVDGIARKVEHITFGTETLDQYRHAVDFLEGPDVEKPQVTYDSWLETEMIAGSELVTELREILLRFRNLNRVTLEDRPSGQNAQGYEDYRPSLASVKIKRLTGVDLRWNGPYSEPDDSPDSGRYTFPFSSRQFVYAVVLALLRDLDIAGKRLALDLIVGGYTLSNGKSHFAQPFDPRKALPRRAVKRYLRHFEIRDVETANVPLTDFLSKISFTRVIFNRCPFRGDHLLHAFHGFKAIEIRNCSHLVDLGIIIHRTRNTLRSLTLSSVEMQVWNGGQIYWGQFLRALCAAPALRHLELTDLRTGVLSCSGILQDGVEADSALYTVTWEGNEGIKAGAQALSKVVDQFASLTHEVPPLVNLMEAHVAYLAGR
ncbi:hypothetical protein BU26DRAFT_609465 [Trematosphaeria pertusa]|uniref:F-box domain-containing protein n=1 Tax=Trematosphaeria pertusa TaxID=390896 RepID=A0A6A6I0J7_9PLEO|nr:uncharacterized protein BU26DRAFT_609465 [Trematosphaeria pertusa]KAF2243413.1 hypothetical protein BU26DRAFT_609465 [Trematosphaeria pertusa]